MSEPVERADVRAATAVARETRSALRSLTSREDALRRDVKGRVEAELDRQMRRHLTTTTVEKLKDPQGGPVRARSLRAAGFTTADEVLKAGTERLQSSPGLGPATAAAAVRAAQAETGRARAAAVLRIEPGTTDPATVAMVAAAVRCSSFVRRARTVRALHPDLGDRLQSLVRVAGPARSRVRRFFAGGRRRARADAGARELVDLTADLDRTEYAAKLREVVEAGRAPEPAPGSVWAEFGRDTSAVYALLDGFWPGRTDLGGGPARPAVARGPGTTGRAQPPPRLRFGTEAAMPRDLLERIRAQQLDETLLTAHLRRYQAFAAKFAVAQRRVVLGDEMGLGKTVEAIAVMAHLAATLRSRGRPARLLVVCPASVLVNWCREIAAHSGLRTLPLHGPSAHDGFTLWAGTDGVAVTTYDTLRNLPPPVPGDGTRRAADVVVVDEAHYVKNDAALRSQATRAWTDAADYVLLLTGTPLENRLDEFRSLLSYVVPGRRPRAEFARHVADPHRFRDSVAPHYLRRNKDEVLDELPEIVRTDEWVDPGPGERRRYLDAVTEGSFMAMRRAAFADPDPERCAKVARLLEIVDEAGASGTKVLVFSFFVDVLATAAEALRRHTGRPPLVVGPLTGATTVQRRQEMVDRFTAADGPAVLVAQVQAGGVGLNLQAASVVVLCEPQVKPSFEAQAVSRAHRMGQLRSVQLHRLLTPDTVDERMLEILEAKEHLFDAYVRRSALADRAPEAHDTSFGLGLRIVAAERARLGIAPVPGHDVPDPYDAARRAELHAAVAAAARAVLARVPLTVGP